jgi:hypothetical protein
LVPTGDQVEAADSRVSNIGVGDAITHRQSGLLVQLIGHSGIHEKKPLWGRHDTREALDRQIWIKRNPARDRAVVDQVPLGFDGE